MNLVFAETLRVLRNEKGYSQQQLAEKVVVNRSTVARWESGSRLPDIDMIYRIANALDIAVAVLLDALYESEELSNIIMVDDEKVILTGGLSVLEKVFPNSVITGFTKPSEALSFARENRIALAFLDIEMGHFSGMDLCRELLRIDRRTNVIFLTAYRDYSFEAWDTGAIGFMLKPLTADAIRTQLPRLHRSLPPGI